MDERKFPADPSITQQYRAVKQERDTYLNRLKQLNSIGIALSTEKNPKKLFRMILQKSREITCADAGSLYLVEGNDETGRTLRFKILQNESMQTTQFEETVLPLTARKHRGMDRRYRFAAFHPGCLQNSAEQRIRFQPQIR